MPDRLRNTILNNPEIKEYDVTEGWFQNKNKETIEELKKQTDKLKLTLDNRNSEFDKEKIEFIEEFTLKKNKEKEEYIEEFNQKKELEINELKSSINVILDECTQDQNFDINILIQKIREKLH